MTWNTAITTEELKSPGSDFTARKNEQSWIDELSTAGMNEERDNNGTGAGADLGKMLTDLLQNERQRRKLLEWSDAMLSGKSFQF